LTTTISAPALGDAVIALRAAGCVFAEDEAAVLGSAAVDEAALAALVRRRASGEPLEQVVGYADFCGVRVRLRPGVFVPRVRSELLVRLGAEHADEVRRDRSGGDVVVVDLCCGSGALGLAVAARSHPSILYAADVDPNAVACARDNLAEISPPSAAERADIVDLATRDAGRSVVGGGDSPAEERDDDSPAAARDDDDVGSAGQAPAGGRAFQSDLLDALPAERVFQGDLFDALPAELLGTIDVLLANVPYVATRHIPLLPAEAREHEPHTALDGGADGLDVFRAVVTDAPRWLAPGGIVLSEITEAQIDAAVSAVRAAGLLAEVARDEDLEATVVTGRR
jgi:release factor glutamine methyltransferase